MTAAVHIGGIHGRWTSRLVAVGVLAVVLRVCASDVADAAATAAKVAIPGLAVATAALDKAGAAAAAAGSSLVGAATAWFTQSLLTAAGAILVEPGGFASSATRPDVTAAAFLGRDGAYHRVASAAVVLLVGFIFLGVIQGLFSGEPGQALFRVVRDTPIAVLAILGFPWLVSQLLDMVDGLSAAILPTGEVLRSLMDKHVFTAFSVIGTGLPQPAAPAHRTEGRTTCRCSGTSPRKCAWSRRTRA